jgi:hypothetical protein
MPDWRDGLDERTCEADCCTKMMDRLATRSRAAQRRHYIYVVELDDAVGVSPSQVAFGGVAGDRRHGMPAQDAVSWATSWLLVAADGSG